MKKIIIFGALAVGLIGLILFLSKQLKIAMDTCWNIKKFRFEKLGLRYMRINLDVEIINKTLLGFTIKKQVYDIFINGKFLTKIKSEKPVVIKPKAPKILNFKIEIDPRDLFDVGFITKLIEDALFRPDKLVILTKGYITIAFGGILQIGKIAIDIPYTLEEILTEEETETVC